MVWRTAASGYFGGWNTGNMTTDQAAVSAFAEGKASDIYTPATPPNLSLWSTQQFRSNSAHSKILVLLLSFNRPLDLLTGQKIDAERALFQGNLREFHHFFPKDYLTTRGVSVRRASALANFVMLTASSNKIITNRAPSDYLKDVRAHLGSNLETALSANLISQAAFSAALADDYETFLNERAKTIQETVGSWQDGESPTSDFSMARRFKTTVTATLTQDFTCFNSMAGATASGLAPNFRSGRSRSDAASIGARLIGRKQTLGLL